MGKKGITKMAIDILDFSDDLNIRRIYDIEDLKRSLSDQGQDEPVYVHAEQDGSFEGLRGFRRVKALKELGMEFANVIVKTDMSEQEKIEFRIDHGERRQISKPETAVAVAKMLRQGFNDKRVMVKLYPLFKSCNWCTPIESASENAVEFHDQVIKKLEKGAFKNAKLLSRFPDTVFDRWAKGEEGKLEEGQAKISFADLVRIEKIESVDGKEAKESAIQSLLDGQAIKATGPKVWSKTAISELRETLHNPLSHALIDTILGLKMEEKMLETLDKGV